MGAIDLRLKEKIRGQALGLRRIHPAGGVTKLQPRRRRPSICIAHVELHRHGRQHFKEHRHLSPKAEILRPLTHVELQCCLPPA